MVRQGTQHLALVLGLGSLLARKMLYPSAWATSCTPRATSEKKGLVMSPITSPIVLVRWVTNPRASRLGR